MAITFDPNKNDRNIRERGLPFERASEFDFDTALLLTEIRKGENPPRCCGLSGQAAASALLHPDTGRNPGYKFSQDQQEGGKTLWQTANH